MPSWKNLIRTILIILPICVLSLTILNTSFAEDCDDYKDLDDKADCLERKIDKKEKEYESTSKKLSDVRGDQEEISKQLSDLSTKTSITQGEIDKLTQKIEELSRKLAVISKNLGDRKESLKYKVSVRNKAIRSFYQNGQLTPFESFLLFEAPAGLTGFEYANHAYAIEKAIKEDATRIIYSLNTEISSFEKDKKEAEEIKKDIEVDQGKLVSLKAQLDAQKTAAQSEFNVLGEQKKNFEKTLSSLSEQISDLSKKQQDIINAKSGGDNGTVGDYDSPSAEVPDAPFSPAYAAFSYGAYTHYKGMSQYGAKGRAEDGQDYKKIIEFYYDNDVKEDDDMPDKINVDGYGEMDFQEYLYGLAEMPSNWPKDALKAQAVAARTYAYRYVKAGKSICTSQSCQVFLKSKSDDPPGDWKDAVDDTENEIISGDSHGMYSSTTGGYIDSIGWDKKGDWPSQAYEKRAKSPWFYWAWYSKSYTFNSDKCGRNHPWLDEEEMADILNAVVVWDEGSSDEKSHISPTTTSCWGGDPYSIGEMRDKAKKYGGGYAKVTSVSTSIGNNGQTASIRMETDKGSVSISGDRFKTVFNLRAPGYISIKSRLYEIKKD
jgi:peptidoglycan hydrolase-like amidase/peptidoglycan hydrolase CwlO-like protein